MTTVYIYGLVCPIDKRIMYVGKANNAEKRLREHIGKSRGGEKSSKGIWVCKLLDNNLVPEITIIEECDQSEWQIREQYWISHYRSINPDLKNSKNETTHRTGKRRSRVFGKVKDSCIMQINWKEIRHRMIDKGVSLVYIDREMARGAGINPRTIGTPGCFMSETVDRLARYLQCSPFEIIELIEKET